MINLMIVDDEPMVVNIVRSQFDWKAMEIDNVYTANSFQQACAICETYQIHLMICDIELLQESGLELLEWLQSRGMDVVSIFLTGYDNFEYCKRALELGSLEYILKPAKFSVLEKGIRHGVEKVKERLKASQYRAYGESWLNNTAAIQMQFWSEVLNGSIQASEKGVLAAVDRYGVDLDLQERYTVVLLHSWFQDVKNQGWDRSTLQYAVRQIAFEVMGEPLISAVVLPEQSLMAFIVCQTRISVDQKDLRLLCENVIQLCGQYLKLQSDVFVGEFVPVWQLTEQMEDVMYLSHSAVSKPGQVLFSYGCRLRDKFSPIPWEEWRSYLSYGQFSLLRCSVEEYLHLQAEGAWDAISMDALAQFLQDFTTMLENYLERQGVPSHWIREENVELYRQAQRNLQACQLYTSWTLDTLPGYLREAASKGDITGKAKQYIKSHIVEDLSRDSIAEEIGVNAEYLSRIFKRKEGCSLIEYIQRKKMETAAGMLQTGQSIGDVAAQLGYHNFAYFTQIFKKYTGETPSGFKKRLAL